MSLKEIQKALQSSSSLIISALCEVIYQGRAESFLPLGERIIIVKQDNTLLIHQPTGSNPVNYMKEASITALKEDKDIILQAQATKEYLQVIIKKLHFFHAQQLEDGQKIQLQGTEKDMADMLMENPEMVEAGFTPVNQEEQTKYGFVDVLGVDNNNRLTIVECKRYHADLSAVTQLRRYVEKMKATKGIEDIRGIIAAPKISSNAKKMLEDWGFEFKVITPPKHLERHNRTQTHLGSF